MNFGNPEKPEIMGQFAAAIQGMAAACTALDFPVVSGNVSLYNETEGRPILPTPAIGGLGVIEDARAARGIAICPHLDLVLIGETTGWLGQSLWLREIAGREEGAPPPVHLVAERRNGDFVRSRIAEPAASTPAMTYPMAACWWPWRRWRSPARPAAPWKNRRTASPPPASGSARTSPAT